MVMSYGLVILVLVARFVWCTAPLGTARFNQQRDRHVHRSSHNATEPHFLSETNYL